jgi:hypothetical protein
VHVSTDIGHLQVEPTRTHGYTQIELTDGTAAISTAILEVPEDEQCLSKHVVHQCCGSDLKSPIFWDITPCSSLYVKRRFGGTYRLHLQGRNNKFSKKPACKQVATNLLERWFLAKLIFSTLKMEAICSSETSVDI